ncbi:MAG: putative glycosyltransferase EpsJ [candidate division BRC1 bacterium ADurb.BinA364]|nr:MAG: putative glycosyltransferase EpsJ [candidate division BRC1 bacterium ADurb.BinA364]
MKTPSRANKAGQMRVSIVVPAFNEEKWIGECLRSIARARLQADPEGAVEEIIVVDNNSNDRTAELARGEGARVVFEPVNQIARARNAGAAAAAGDWLLFIDADSTLPANLLAETLSVMRGGKAIGGGALVRFPATAPRMALWGAAIWKQLSIRLHWAAGSYIFARADAFREVGGFNQELFFSEEIDLSRRLGRLGRKRGLGFVIIVSAHIDTSDRKCYLYSTWDLFRLAAGIALRPFSSRKSRKAAFPWYDGRR